MVLILQPCLSNVQGKWKKSGKFNFYHHKHKCLVNYKQTMQPLGSKEIIRKYYDLDENFTFLLNFINVCQMFATFWWNQFLPIATSLVLRSLNPWRSISHISIAFPKCKIFWSQWDQFDLNAIFRYVCQRKCVPNKMSRTKWNS